MKNRIFTIAKKEAIHIRRDPRTLGIAIFIPVFMLTLYGYALTLDVKHISTAVVDQDKTQMSREFISEFGNSGYFDIKYYAEGLKEVKELIDRGDVSVAIVVPPDFSHNLLAGKNTGTQTIIDGVNYNVAQITSAYVDAISAQYWSGYMADRLKRIGRGRELNLRLIEYDPRFWYNPELKSMNYLVPGLICIILMMLSAVLTSLTIVTEREKGTMESLVVSPIKNYELILGKVIPYALISFFDIVLVVALGTVVFNVPLKGSIILLFGLSFIFLLSVLSIGLLISAVAKGSQEAYLMAIFSSMLPSILLSGFVFPISSMPLALQLITYVVPARYFMVIVRGIFLKGVGISFLWPSAIALVFFASFMIGVTTLRFRKRIS